MTGDEIDKEPEATPSVNKKMLLELGIFLSLLVVFFVILTPWALPRIRYMVNNDFYQVIPDENYGFCTDTETGNDVFRGNRCTGGRCTEGFYDTDGEIIKAYNYDEDFSTGSEVRFTDCENTSYFFFEKFAPAGL